MLTNSPFLLLTSLGLLPEVLNESTNITALGNIDTMLTQLSCHLKDLIDATVNLILPGNNVY